MITDRRPYQINYQAESSISSQSTDDLAGLLASCYHINILPPVSQFILTVISSAPSNTMLLPHGQPWRAFCAVLVFINRDKHRRSTSDLVNTMNRTVTCLCRYPTCQDPDHHRSQAHRLQVTNQQPLHNPKTACMFLTSNNLVRELIRDVLAVRRNHQQCTESLNR